MFTVGPPFWQQAAAGGDPLRAFVITLALGQGANGGTVFDDDISPNSDLSRTGAVTTATAPAPPFGASSILFPGTLANSSLLAQPTASWINGSPSGKTLYEGFWCWDGWIYPTSLATRVQCIGSDDFDPGATAWNGILLIGTTGVLQLQVRNGIATAAAGTIVDNAWQHVAMTGDGAGGYNLFVDGVHKAAGTGTPYTKQGGGSWLYGEQNKNVGGFERNFIGSMFCMRWTWSDTNPLATRYPGTTSFTPPSSLADYA
jgi:hypothetical protein